MKPIYINFDKIEKNRIKTNEISNKRKCKESQRKFESPS